jgi:predicted nucleotidyltransferase
VESWLIKHPGRCAGWLSPGASRSWPSPLAITPAGFRLFGSAARGDGRPVSDIDLLVDFDEDSSLFDLMRMSREFEALLGRAVDVVSAGGLKTRDRAIVAESVDL